MTNAAVCPTVITRTWQATDACTNSVICSQTVTVLDTTPPVLTCATNKTVLCGTTWTFDAPTASDSCSGTNVTIIILNTVTNAAVCPTVITRTWQATDACTNSVICSQTVTVLDTTPPVLTCATNKTVLCGTTWTFDAPTASDSCSGTNVTIIILNTVTNAAVCPTVITRTWQATDACGNTNSCNQVVTVVDTTPPVLTCSNPTAMVFSVGTTNDNFVGPEPGFPSADLLLRLQAAGVSSFKGFDNCAVNTFFAHTFTNLPSCITGATLHVGLRACSSALNDNFGLSFTAPSGTLVPPSWGRYLGDGNPAPGLFSMSWGAGATGDVVLDLSQLPNADGSTTDLIPTLNAQGLLDLVLQDDSSIDFAVLTVMSCCGTNSKTVACGTAWTFDAPTATDSCSGTNVTLTVLSTVTSGLCPQTITRTWQATDICGNSVTNSQTVTLLDTTPPVLTCATNKTILCGTTWTFDPPTASDSCSGTNVTITILTTLTNAAVCPTVITRTWQATDACGNTNTCSQVVTVMNTTPPVVTCPTNKTVQCNSNWNFDLPTVLSVCSGTNATITVVTNITQALTPCLKYFTRIWQVTDVCSNSVTCSQVVTVFDTTPPVLTCATNKTILCGTTWTFDPPTASDSCSGTNVTITILTTLTNAAVCPTVITRTWQATDACGNTATCSQAVAVIDTTSPLLICATNKTVNCDLTWSFDPPSASDSCSGTNVTLTILTTVTNGVCPWLITRTWRATDACSNSVTCSQTVAVVDTTPPTAICATNKTVNPGTTWTFDPPTASDKCCGTNITITVAGTVTNVVSCSQIITRTWRVMDCCGNLATCSQTVTVLGGIPPNNDLCVNAIQVVAGSPAACGTTVCATASVPGSIPPACGASANSPDVWYVFTSICNGPVTIDTCGVCPGQTSTFDSVLSIYTGVCGTLTQVACNDDAGGGCGLQSRVTFNGLAGVAYRIRVAGFLLSNGAFRLNIAATATSPSNDLCAAAIPVLAGSPAACGTTVCATASAPGTIPPACGASANSPDVWYTFTPVCTGSVTIDTCGLCPGQVGPFDSVLSVYTGSCGSFVPMACNDDAGGSCGLQSRVTFNGVAGVAYRIRVAGYAGSSGLFRLNISSSATVPLNDACSAAIPVTIGSPAACGTTLCATPSIPGSIPAPCGASATAPDVWYRFTPTCTGSVTIDTCGLCPGQSSPYDTVLSVYTGSCGLFTQVACNDDAGGGCGLLSRVTFNGIGGVTYRIRVAGWAGSSGLFRLNIAQTMSPPANDLCANATPISNGTYGFNTCGANTDGPNQASVGCQPNQDVWFRFTAPCSGQVTMDTCNSSFNTVLSIYAGGCGSLVPVTCNDNAVTGGCVGTPNSFVTFNAIAGTTYFIRVGGTGTATGSGLLTVQGPFPLFPTCPAPSGPSWTRLFKVMGPASNTPWSWSIGVACCANFGNANVPGVPIGGTANTLAAAFAASINAACPASGVSATAVGNNGLMTVSVVNSCSLVATPFIFRIGSAGALQQNQCVVADVSGPDPLPVTGSCSFNPEMIELPLSGHDLNRNGLDDAIDIMTGASGDLNENGLPDESESCLPPQLGAKAESQVVEMGANLTLSVAATGTAPFTYQWSHAGAALKDDGHIAGAARNLLTIQALTKADLGDYTVTVSNACGTLTTVPATLSTETPAAPIITHLELLKGSFQFAFDTKFGLTYVVEFKDSLSDPTWTQVKTLVGDGLEHSSDFSGPLPATRFYRVRMTAP